MDQRNLAEWQQMVDETARRVREYLEWGRRYRPRKIDITRLGDIRRLSLFERDVLFFEMLLGFHPQNDLSVSYHELLDQAKQRFRIDIQEIRTWEMSELDYPRRRPSDMLAKMLAAVTDPGRRLIRNLLQVNEAETSLAEARRIGPASAPLSAPLDDPCGICHEDLEVGAAVQRCPNGHAFHEDCMVRWRVRSSDRTRGYVTTCPVCRKLMQHRLRPVKSSRRGPKSRSNLGR